MSNLGCASSVLPSSPDENLNLDDVVLALVGKKFDLADRREVSIERPEQEYREAFGVDCWEVSAKTGLIIELLFAEMLRSTGWGMQG